MMRRCGAIGCNNIARGARFCERCTEELADLARWAAMRDGRETRLTKLYHRLRGFPSRAFVAGLRQARHASASKLWIPALVLLGAVALIVGLQLAEALQDWLVQGAWQ